MGFASRGVTSAEILAAIIDDATRFSGADIATINTAAARPKYSILDFWSDPVATFGVGTSAGDKVMSNVVIPNLTGLIIQKAYAMMSIDALGNSGGGDIYNDTTTYIQVDKSAAGYINALKLTLNTFFVDGGVGRRSEPYLLIGGTDISSRVANNATTNFKWTSAHANSTQLNFVGVKSGVRLIVNGV